MDLQPPIPHSRKQAVQKSHDTPTHIHTLLRPRLLIYAVRCDLAQDVQNNCSADVRGDRVRGNARPVPGPRVQKQRRTPHRTHSSQHKQPTLCHIDLAARCQRRTRVVPRRASNPDKGHADTETWAWPEESVTTLGKPETPDRPWWRWDLKGVCSTDGTQQEQCPS